jgi:hypothetical protein
MVRSALVKISLVADHLGRSRVNSASHSLIGRKLKRRRRALVRAEGIEPPTTAV